MSGSRDGVPEPLFVPSSLSHLEDPPSLGAFDPRAHPAAAVESRYAPGPEIGRGAMGRVRLIEDLRLHRDLAWKEGDASVLREAWVTAQLEHPGILPIHDLGATEDGQSFFAMRVVRGDTLAKVMSATPSEAQIRERLRLLLQATQAVAWAHHRGVIHRDLKPTNILVGPFGEVQVIDWGLAAIQDDAPMPLARDARDAIARYRLAPGPIGTPGYMAPEQQRGEAAAAPADVYSLGAILRALVGPSPGAELRSIVERCLEERPADRYPDAAALAADLGAYLDGNRVGAHRYRPIDHLQRFVSTFRLPLAIGAFAALILALAVLIGSHQVATERDHAVQAQRETETALQRADEALARADLALADALANHAQAALLRGLRFDSEVLAARALRHAEDPRARGIVAAWGLGSGIVTTAFAPQGALSECSRLELFKGVATSTILCATRHELRLIDPTTLVTRSTFPLTTQTATLSPDGGRILHTALCDPSFFDVSRRVELRQFAQGCPSYLEVKTAGRYALLIGRHHLGLVDLETQAYRMLSFCGHFYGADVATDGRYVAMCGDGTIHMGHFDHEERVPAPTVGFARHAIEVTSLAMLDDETLILADTSGRVSHQSLDGSRGADPIPVAQGLIRTLSLSPDKRWLAAAGDAGGLVVLDARTLGFVTSLPAALGHRALWLADSTLVPYVPGAAAAATRRFSFGDAKPVLYHFTKGVTSLAVDREGDRLLVAHQTQVSMVGLREPQAIRRFEGMDDVIKGVSFDATGRAYFGDSTQAFARIEHDGSTTALAPPRAGVRRHASIGDWLIIMPPRGYLHLNHVDTLNEPWAHFELTTDDAPERPHYASWLDLSAWPQGHHAFALGPRTVTPIALSPMPHLLAPIPLPEPDATALAVFPDEERFATARGHVVSLWDRETGALDGVLVAADGSADLAERADTVDLMELAIHPDGTWVAAGARDGRLFVWRTDTSLPRATLTAHTERLVALQFLDDALVTGSWDGVVRLLSLASLEVPAASLVEAIEARWLLRPGSP